VGIFISAGRPQDTGNGRMKALLLALTTLHKEQTQKFKNCIALQAGS
jgi:hypothetical protein